MLNETFLFVSQILDRFFNTLTALFVGAVIAISTHLLVNKISSIILLTKKLLPVPEYPVNKVCENLYKLILLITLKIPNCSSVNVLTSGLFTTGDLSTFVSTPNSGKTKNLDNQGSTLIVNSFFGVKWFFNQLLVDIELIGYLYPCFNYFSLDYNDAFLLI